MKQRGICVGVVTVLLFSLGGGLRSAAEGTGSQSFVGRVYDIDFVMNAGSTQVLIESPEHKPNLVATTKSPRVQAVLQTALQTRLPVTVTYRDGQPATISSVSLGQPNTPDCSAEGCVQTVRCVEPSDECSVVVLGKERPAKTIDLGALGILLTSIGKKRAVEYLTLGKNDLILRVKFNEP
jgi:hypothetical protein